MTFARLSSPTLLSCQPRILVVGIALLAVGGCQKQGPATYSVKGQITVDGIPVKQGDIRFIPDDKSLAAEGAKIVDGQYVARAKPGKNRVSISALDIGPETKYIDGSPLAKNFIPDRYNTQTELELLIEPTDSNEFSIDLKL